MQLFRITINMKNEYRCVHMNTRTAPLLFHTNNNWDHKNNGQQWNDKDRHIVQYIRYILNNR